MTSAKPIFVIKTPDLLGQKLSTLPHLSKKELVELHTAPTIYPRRDDQSFSGIVSNKYSHPSSNGKTPDSLLEVREKSQEQKSEHQDAISGNKGKSILKHSNAFIVQHGVESQKEEGALHFYEGKNQDEDLSVDFKKEETHLNLDHLPSPSSLMAGITGLLSPKLSFDDESSLSSISAATKLSLEGQLTPSLNSELSSLSETEKGDDFNIDSHGFFEVPITKEGVPQGIVVPGKIMNTENRMQEDNLLVSAAATWMSQSDETANNEITSRRSENESGISDLTTSNESHIVGENVKNSEVQGTRKEHAHETTNKMGEKESKGNNGTMKSLVAHVEFASVNGSVASSQATLSESVAATLRVTHLLDELMAAVSRLRLEGQDGKALTIQLKNETLADTNVRLVSTAKHLEVSFLTSNPNSHLLLNENKNLLMLQTRLNALCSGQVVAVQTQLTPSSGSSQSGSEGDHSRDDLASFDQGNRGNFSNDEDTL